MCLTPFLEVKIGNKFELGGLEDQAFKPMEEVTACNIPRLSSVRHEANLDDCLKVIYSCWEGKQPLEHYVQGREYLATVPRGFSCPSYPAWCLLGRFPIQRKCLWISPLTQFLLLSGVPVRGVQPSRTSLLVLRPQELLTLPYTACVALISPWPLMRQPCAHTIAYCVCLASYSLPHCRGLHTNNQLNLGPIEGDSSHHVQPVLLF